MNRKFAIILFIILVLAVIIVLGGALMPIKTDGGTPLCIQILSLKINAEGGYTCSSQTQSLVMISRNADNVEVSGIKIALSAGDLTKSVTIRNGMNPKEGEVNVTMFGKSDTIALEIPGANEERTYNITTGKDLPNSSKIGQAEKASIVVIVKVENTEKECDVSSRVVLKQCV